MTCGWNPRRSVEKLSPWPRERYLVALHGGVNLAGPVLQAAGKRLCPLESLLPHPVRYDQRASAMMADHDDVRVWVKFLMQPGGQVSHWNMQAIGKRAEFYLPHFPNIQQAEIQAANGCRIWPGSLQIACQVVDGNLKLHIAQEYSVRL